LAPGGPEPSVGFTFTTPDGCSVFDYGGIGCASQDSSNITFTLPVDAGSVNNTADISFEFEAFMQLGAPCTDCATTITNPSTFIPFDDGFGDGRPDISKDLAPGIGLSSTRSKTTDVFNARSHKRITAMAKHFVNNPGDVINIHAYGPDREIALTKGHLVREQLQADITRLGGNRSAHHVFVTYAGDPDHKKGVDVTIHQHAGTKHTKAHAWVNTHLASKNSTLTDAQRETVAAHLVASSTPEQVQAKWDIDMNEDVSIVDAAQITEIARYFLDNPDQHILVRDHVATGEHGTTVVDAVLAEMTRLAAEDGVVTTRSEFSDWLGQVMVKVKDFTDDLNAAEVEIHAVTVTINDAATAIATTITDVTTLVGDVIKDVETVINPIVTAVDDGAVVVKTVKDVITAVVAL